MEPDVVVSRTIAAPADKVFAAISDIGRMGDWSTELVSAEWSEGFDGPALGARYLGHNRNGGAEWTTESEIVDYVEGERFFFDCTSFRTGMVFAKWGYSIAPADGGCEVTEYWQDLRTEEGKVGSAALSGVEDRVVFNRAAMAETLDRIAAVCEAG